MTQSETATEPRRTALQRLYLWACRRLYHELAWSYDGVAWLVSAGQWATWRRQALAWLPAGGRVLEVGFGTGALLAEMAQGGWQVHGVELSPEMQRIAEGRLARRGLAACAARSRGRAQQLPYPDGCFDAVVATFPAEYVTGRQSLAEFARVLRPPRDGSVGGRLIVGGLAVALQNAAIARLAPLFFGMPPPALLERFQAGLADVGLRGRFVEQPAPGVRVLSLVAERVA